MYACICTLGFCKAGALGGFPMVFFREFKGGLFNFCSTSCDSFRGVPFSNQMIKTESELFVDCQL